MFKSFEIGGVMSFETNKFSVVKKKRLAKSSFSVECNVQTEVEIDKILSVCHNATADTAEILNGEVNYTGTIELCILYCTADGEVGTINSTCPFASKFTDSAITVGDKVGIDVTVEDYSIDNISATNIKIACMLEQSGVLISICETQKVTSGDENMCIKEDEMLVNTLVGEAKETFNVESTISIKEPVKKVLSSQSQVALKSVESGVNFVSVSGEVITRILYLTEKDRFETAYTSENFKEEIELEGVTRDAISDAKACIRNSMVQCQLDQNDKGMTIKYTIPVEVRVVSYLEKKETIVKDLYSTTNDLEVTTDSFDMTWQKQSDFFETKIDGTLTLDEDKPRVDKVMFVGGTNLTITNAYIKNEEVTVEGVAKTNVVYLNDETNSLHSVTMEVPFVVSDKANITCDAAQVEVRATIYDVDVVVKKGREFYFDAKLKIQTSYDCDEVGAVISNVEVASQLPEKDCAIELFLAPQGETSWDVAKNAKVKEEQILLQNPELVFPLEQDANIIIYYQKQ